MLELVVVVAVIMVVTAVSMPSFLQAVRIYRLNDAATQVAGVLKFTRYEAIRLNVPAVNPQRARTLVAAAGTYVYTDSNNSNSVQNTEKQVLFSGNVNLVAAGLPPGGLAAAVGVAGLTTVPVTGGLISFDHRGAVTPPPAVYVLYIGNVAFPDLGYRAVVLLPSGSVQIWTSASGNWQQIN